MLQRVSTPTGVRKQNITSATLYNVKSVNHMVKPFDIPKMK